MIIHCYSDQISLIGRWTNRLQSFDNITAGKNVEMLRKEPTCDRHMDRIEQQGWFSCLV
jgi:hypothetical protein